MLAPQNLIAMLCSLAGASDSFDHLLRGFVLLIRRALIRSGSNAGNPDETNWDEISAPQEVNNMLETTMKIWADNFISQGIEKGIEKGKEEDAINMLQDGFTVEKVCKYTGLSADQVENLAKKCLGKVCEPAAPYHAPKPTKAPEGRKKK